MPLLFVLAAVLAPAQAAPSTTALDHPPFVDPVPHAAITQPYRVCQDLEELTSRIDNLYRKPYAKLSHDGIAQPETVIFKDVITGHEITGLTRELCSDISHPDLKRPVWNIDGSRILFMGNRGFYRHDGSFVKDEWPGWKFIMDADYQEQRPLLIAYVDSQGKVTSRQEGIDGKFNIFDRKNPRYVYYAVGDTLWRVELARDRGDNMAVPLCHFSNARRKIIQDISPGDRLLIQDINPDVDRTTGKPTYMPEIHLVDLNKQPGEEGFYYHHPFDYGLPEVRDTDGKVVHDAANNWHFHALQFDGDDRITWNYGPMTDVGEYLGWSLNIRRGLDGVPTHSPVEKGSSVNRWGQYQSHGDRVAQTPYSLYFAGPAKVPGKGDVGGWGLWIADDDHPDTPPQFVLVAPGGHVAGGDCQNPDLWAAYLSAGWRTRVKESDSIVWGDTRGKWEVLCYTYSDVRGGTRNDPKTGQITWSGPDNNDYRPYSSIPRPLLSPDGTKLWFHSSMLDPTEDWTGAYVAVTHRPDPPRDLRLGNLPGTGDTGANGVTLEWRPAKNAHETKGYHVYRGDADGHAMMEISAGAVSSAVVASEEPLYTYTDRSAKSGITYTYAVTAEEWSTLESDTTSNSLKVTVGDRGSTAAARPALTGWDRTAPAAVQGFTASREPDADGQFRLTWKPGPEPDIRYYNIYFSREGRPSISQKRLIVSPMAGNTSYLDWSAPLGTDAYYAITAVDRQGNESAPAYAEVKRNP